jgi:hypothetical protein
MAQAKLLTLTLSPHFRYTLSLPIHFSLCVSLAGFNFKHHCLGELCVC